MAAIERKVRREVEVFACPYPDLAGEIDRRAAEREIVSVSHTLTNVGTVSVVLVTLRPREAT